jgi:hypothetical protein
MILYCASLVLIHEDRDYLVLYKKNVLETCVNGAMQDPSLGIDAELHQFINKL